MEPGNQEKGRRRGRALMALLAAKRAREAAQEATIRMGPDPEAGPSEASGMEVPSEPPNPPQESAQQEEEQNVPPPMEASRLTVGAIGAHAKTINFNCFFFNK